MLTPAPMRFFTAIVLSADLDKASACLLQQGVLHLTRIKDLESWAQALPSASNALSLERWENIRKKIEGLLEKSGMPDAGWTAGENMSELIPDAGALSARVDAAAQRLTPWIMEREKLEQEMNRSRDILRKFDLQGLGDFAAMARGTYSFIDVVTARIPAKHIVDIDKKLEGLAYVFIPVKALEGKVLVLILTLRKDRAVLQKIWADISLEKVSQEDTRFPNAKAAHETVASLQASAAALDHEMARLDREYHTQRMETAGVLRELLFLAEAGAAITKAQAFFQMTERSVLLSGWVPAMVCSGLGVRLRQVLEGRVYTRDEAPHALAAVLDKRTQVPVLLDNPLCLRPFEMIVANFGLPDYKAIDPTPFVAVSFLIIFGAMFGDVGQGLVLLLAGSLMVHRRQGMVAGVGPLVSYAGAAACLFGFLYGSFFGMEGVIPALWAHPLLSIPALIGNAAILGIVMIGLGVTINVINAFWSGDMIRVIFGKAGLIAALFYGSVIAMGVRVFIHGAGPIAPWIPAVCIGFPISLLFFKGPAEKFVDGRGGAASKGAFTGMIETCVEAVEMATGFLANTFSFIRVAAFALAHAGLFLAVFALAGMVRATAAGTLGAVLVIIAGNIFILLFEGMIVTIQGIRLEYYEFFSRFFKGEGKPYRPARFGLYPLRRAGL